MVDTNIGDNPEKDELMMRWSRSISVENRTAARLKIGDWVIPRFATITIPLSNLSPESSSDKAKIRRIRDVQAIAGEWEMHSLIRLHPPRREWVATSLGARWKRLKYRIKHWTELQVDPKSILRHFAAFLRWIWDMFLGLIILVLVLGIGLGLPSIAVYEFGNGRQLLDAAASAPSSTTLSLALFGRLLELAFIAIASLLPAILYFLFQRQRLATVLQIFYREVLLLDPHVHTVDEAEKKYRARVNELFGTSHLSDIPMLITTLLITLGWMLVLLPVGDVSKIANDSGLENLFIPHETVLTFAFLGAYFFAVNLLFRRNVRADLTPKAYNHITVRVLIAIILGWAVSTTRVPDGILSPLVFLIGIVPETGTQVLAYTVRRTFGAIPPIRKSLGDLEDENPVSKLDGINLYDRARLLEEGIENIENVAHFNPVELMLRTRLPTSRITDLIDQAILFLHADTVLADLHTLGIRTATDLEGTYAAAHAQGAGEESEFLGLLGEANPHSQAPKLRLILRALEDDDWMMYLRKWRFLNGAGATVARPSDFFTVMDPRNICSQAGLIAWAKAKPKEFDRCWWGPGGHRLIWRYQAYAENHPQQENQAAD
jgi:hypothetical protein